MCYQNDSKLAQHNCTLPVHRDWKLIYWGSSVVVCPCDNVHLVHVHYAYARLINYYNYQFDIVIIAT